MHSPQTAGLRALSANLTFLLEIAVLFTTTTNRSASSENTTIEQWGVFELTLNSPGNGNPLIDVELSVAPVVGELEIKRKNDYEFAEMNGRAVPLPGRAHGHPASPRRHVACGVVTAEQWPMIAKPALRLPPMSSPEIHFPFTRNVARFTAS